jgi:DNA-binding transcriptional MerR regulator
MEDRTGGPPAAPKSAMALRTISEVAHELDLPQHILRFWETRFPELKPMQRAGNRRYYRPADVALCRALKRLLHEEGYTVKGVRRLIAEKGLRHLLDDPDGSPLSQEAPACAGVDTVPVHRSLAAIAARLRDALEQARA